MRMVFWPSQVVAAAPNGMSGNFFFGAFVRCPVRTPVISQKDANDLRRGEVSPERLPGHHLE
jgi:hypothetical protein